MDLIFTMTSPAAKLAKKITKGPDIPVVFILYDAIKSEIAESLLKHSGNLTGIRLCGSTPKALGKLLIIAPGTKHVFTPVCFDTGAQVSRLADNIPLKGNHPAGLPVETSDFFLGINMKIDDSAGIVIPYHL